MPDMTIEEELSVTCEQRDALDIECARLEKEVAALRIAAIQIGHVTKAMREYVGPANGGNFAKYVHGWASGIDAALSGANA